ncbi:MAG: hypothetical protein ACOX02_04330 [Acholeplasmatales bacterium]
MSLTAHDITREHRLKNNKRYKKFERRAIAHHNLEIEALKRGDKKKAQYHEILKMDYFLTGRSELPKGYKDELYKALNGKKNNFKKYLNSEGHIKF